MEKEKRLIDANALTDDTYILNGWDAPIIREWLADQPTVDAVEVVHGRWNESDWSGIKVGGFMACSNCNVMIPTPDGKRYCLHRLHYCPNCGAKMDGGNEDG